VLRLTKLLFDKMFGDCRQLVEIILEIGILIIGLIRLLDMS